MWDRNDSSFEETLTASRAMRQNSSSEMADPLRRAERWSNGLGGSVPQAGTNDGGTPIPIETGTPSTSRKSGFTKTSGLFFLHFGVFSARRKRFTPWDHKRQTLNAPPV